MGKSLENHPSFVSSSCFGVSGLLESAGVEQASGDVVGEIGEAEADAEQGFESAVDGFGGSVRAVLVVEEREDVVHAAFHGAFQSAQFRAPEGAVRHGQ